MGKHRAGPVIAAVASLGVVAATAPLVAAVELSAFVVVGSSTNPTGDGVRDFYRGAFDRPGGDVVTVNFLSGPLGVYRALDDTRSDGDTVVLSSGWGAANVSLLLTYLAATGSADPALTAPDFYVLDNNVASPNGGYGTRLPWFALLGVNPLPTPPASGVGVVNVVYEYDINSNIPAYLLNGPAMANSLIAYFQRRLNQQDLVLPVGADGASMVPAGCDASCTVATAQGGQITFTRVGDGRYGFAADNGDAGYVEVVGDTTYVSYMSDGLPLVAPLRALGEPGERIADLIEPAMAAVVDFGYPDNDPLANPDRYIPARLIPTAQETRTFLNAFADGVRKGLATLDDEPTADSPASRTDVGGQAKADDTDTDPAPAATSGRTSTKPGPPNRKPLRVLRESVDFSPKRSFDGAGADGMADGTEAGEARGGARPHRPIDRATRTRGEIADRVASPTRRADPDRRGAHPEPGR